MQLHDLYGCGYDAWCSILRRVKVAVSAFVFLECVAGRSKDVAKLISGIPGVKLSHAVTGPHDVIAFVEGPDINALGITIISRIQAVSGVLRTTTNVVIE